MQVSPEMLRFCILPAWNDKEYAQLVRVESHLHKSDQHVE
jgi:hypothetical protein